ncbi:hypothetical protein TWF481_000638 [Arthrobotrys musiformis]|uniref:Uncharacterized protein n=1 Tax=Arthrobotrys musiformis TaxID=47236 RepID=A0AAV9WN63_9PEZI
MSQPQGRDQNQPTEQNATPRVPMLYISPPKTDSTGEVEAASVPASQCPVYSLLEDSQVTSNHAFNAQIPGSEEQQARSDENIPFSTTFQNENSQTTQQDYWQHDAQHSTSDIARS